MCCSYIVAVIFSFWPGEAVYRYNEDKAGWSKKVCFSSRYFMLGQVSTTPIKMINAPWHRAPKIDLISREWEFVRSKVKSRPPSSLRAVMVHTVKTVAGF